MRRALARVPGRERHASGVEVVGVSRCPTAGLVAQRTGQACERFKVMLTPGSFATTCATDPTTAPRRWNCRRGLGRSWLLATAAADEVGELRLRSCCAENPKSVLIRNASSRSDSVRRSGCRRSASCRTFVGARETRRSWLSKIICGVIFYETLCKADAPAPERAVDSPPEAAIRSNFRLPIASTALGSSSGTPWTILSQGNRYADDDHQFES